MANVELLTAEDAPLLARPFYMDGDPGPIARALAHLPELMELGLPFIGSVFAAGTVDGRLREMVVLRVSSANGCRYCTETHTGVARRMEFAADEVAALRGEQPVPARWSVVERAVLAFAELLSDRPGHAVAALRPHFADAAIVELVTLGAVTVMLNRFATALELPV
ncbi:MAG: carboxymuconolactone decarboxylase family protein [Chloroflexota bacterium]